MKIHSPCEPFFFTSFFAFGFRPAGKAIRNKKRLLHKNASAAAAKVAKLIYSSPVPFGKLSWIDTLPDFAEAGPKLVASGTVYKADGKTPAPGVVLYIYHTDQTGHYTNRNGEKGYAGANGYIKGWVKTNAKGEYKFYTLKPVPYPGATIPAHIHPVIKEADKNEYWIDEYLFDDDPLLTAAERKKQEGRGGSGIVKLKESGGVLYAERNIVLGKNIPDYPQKT